MRRTRTGTLVLAAGWACFPLALVTGSLAPVLVGVALVALAVTRPAPAVTPAVARVSPPRVAAGREFDVLVTATTDDPDAPVFLDAPLPAGLREVGREAHPFRGRADVRLRLVATEPGARVWPPVTVRYQDAWGLVEDEVHVPAAAVLHVLPEPGIVTAGARAGRRHPPSVASRRATGASWEPELERLREYRSGDRLRDIDWAHSTKLNDLIVRELSREAPRPVVVLLHAGPSMRRARRVAKVATASRAALAVVAAAHAANVPAGLVAFSERGVEALVRTTTSRRVVTEATLRVAALPPATPAEDVPFPQSGAVDAASLVAEEREFLAATAAFGPVRGATTPVESALAAVSRATSVPSLVVAFVDAEEDPRLAPALVGRLARKGHRAVVIAPATGAHHYRAEDVDDAAAARLVQWLRNRDASARACAAHHATFTTLGPRLTRADIEGVVRSVR